MLQQNRWIDIVHLWCTCIDANDSTMNHTGGEEHRLRRLRETISIDERFALVFHTRGEFFIWSCSINPNMLDRFDNFSRNTTSHLFSVHIKDNNKFFVLILSGCRKIAICLKELIWLILTDIWIFRNIFKHNSTFPLYFPLYYSWEFAWYISFDSISWNIIFSLYLFFKEIILRGTWLFVARHFPS